MTHREAKKVAHKVTHKVTHRVTHARRGTKRCGQSDPQSDPRRQGPNSTQKGIKVYSPLLKASCESSTGKGT